MTISFRTGVFFIFFFGIFGAGLFLVFYFSGSDLGRFAEISYGNIRGASIEKFSLPSEEMIISSRQAGGDFDGDVALLTETLDNKRRILRVIRNSAELVFEQSVSTEFRLIMWDDKNLRFVISGLASDEGFYLVPDFEAYKLIPLL